MRHILANVFTYVLVIGLILGAMGFAWVRSAQLVIAHEGDVEPRVLFDGPDPTAADWLAFGERTYRVNCQNCHTVDGSGRGMYPPIQRMAVHLTADGGRDYLVNLTLYGLYTGTYGAPMPPMPELSDAEIAAVTNYILVHFAGEGNAPDASRWYFPREVATLRGQRLSEWDVADSRPAIPSARDLGRGVKVNITTDAPAVPEGEDE
ncbi:cbb3-type cytochrome c oxidase subunit III [Neolewinella xylanilytica]|uniref:Cbb3-type cytochrome c oxidase subunit III n=1 Tax=Neolewinella xylanilytica TaxID=1514080 RepID=A0A2S6I8Q0_9BACT|nr:cytochrome c [Neolewinella xylanilytica]PPK87863.1 cbb3-type cytochrome c oxidase subunit III [Neolewinella xylanilytica]